MNNLAKEISETIKCSCYDHIERNDEYTIREILENYLCSEFDDDEDIDIDDLVDRAFATLDYEITVKVNIDRVIEEINKSPEQLEAKQAEKEACNKIRTQIRNLRFMSAKEVKALCIELGISVKGKLKADLVKEAETHLLLNYH